MLEQPGTWSNISKKMDIPAQHIATLLISMVGIVDASGRGFLLSQCDIDG